MSRKQELLLAALIIGAFCLTGTMDYQDAVLQHGINCESATYVNDNGLECPKTSKEK